MTVFVYCKTSEWYLANWTDIFKLTRIDYYYWFVGVLFACYAIFGMCIQVPKTHCRNILLSLLTILLCIVFMICRCSVNHWASIPLFTIGVITAEYSEVVFSLVKKWHFWILFALTCGLMVVFAKYVHEMTLLHIVVNLLQTVLLLLFVGLGGTFSHNIVLGELSYPIYLVHHKLIDFPIYLGYMLPVWLFLLLTIYAAWLLHKTIQLTDRVSLSLSVHTKYHNV